MVVVSIIAILATLAVPSYKSYMARARQKEGLDLFSGYFVSAHSTLAEYGYFPGNFVQTGFSPEGEMGYRLTAADGRDTGILINDNACTVTTAACNCGGACPSFKIWNDSGNGVVGGAIGSIASAGGACGALPATFVGDTAFSIRVSAVISLSAAAQDEFGMDHMKNIVSCTDGVK